MRYVVGLENAACFDRRQALALGAFDGVHRGHLQLLQVTEAAARELDAETTVLTFEPTPVEAFGRLGRKDVRLTLPEERRALIEAAGVDNLVVANFDKALQSTEPEDFARDILAQRLCAAAVVASETHSFGRGGSGNIRTLMHLGCDLGFEVRVLPLLSTDRNPLSSTRIRELLWDGQIEEANDLLGRLYSGSGEVVTGDGRGRTLGFPTANVAVPMPKLVPGPGVYAGWAGVEGSGESWRAAIVIGPSPTFENDTDVRRVEVHLPDREVDLLGQRLSFAFVRRIRPQQRFAGEAELRAAIAEDVAQVRAMAAAELSFSPFVSLTSDGA
ncbi:MAG TPA: riboflavin biosynthesis protein RibF [Armatimonadota bacterium]